MPPSLPPSPSPVEGAQGDPAQHPHTEIPMLRKSLLAQGLEHPSLLPHCLLVAGKAGLMMAELIRAAQPLR